MTSRWMGAWLVALCSVGCSDETASSAARDGGSEAAVVPPPYDTCSVDSDCGWGEIKREILSTKDCMCLYGCPYLPLAKSTVERRMQQHDKLCDPQRDGNGQPCGIDDCSMPPAVVCTAGKCTPVAAD